MELKNKKKIIAIILIVVIVIISGITYGYWNKEYIGKENTNNFNCLNITKVSETSEITLNNAYPITDEEGINDKNNMYEVQIKNTCNLMVQYNVIANVINSSNLEESHVKIGSKKTTEEEYAINLLSNYEETTPTVEEVKKARVIKRGYLKKDETTTISIKEWMDYETTKEEGENKKFISKITIEGSNGENTLGGKILANNEVIEKEPNFIMGEPSNGGTNTGSGLYKTEDDDGESYYFRGAVENNYVKFADMLWRIVRINGDGSIRILNTNILEKEHEFNILVNREEKYMGYTYDNKHICTKENPCTKEEGTASTIKTYLEEWYQSSLAKYDDKIALSNFCNDTSIYSFANSNTWINYYGRSRLENSTPTLHCLNIKQLYGGVYKIKIGLITMDELLYGGLPYGGNNTYSSNSHNYLYISKGRWWSMTPIYFARVGSSQGYAHGNWAEIRIGEINNNSQNYVRPVINLKADVQVTGEGTKEEPYQV